MEKRKLHFRYVNIIENFDMPVIVVINGKEQWIQPNASWKTLKIPKEIDAFEIKKAFYVDSKEISETSFPR